MDLKQRDCECVNMIQVVQNTVYCWASAKLLVTRREFLDPVNDYQLLENYSSRRTWLIGLLRMRLLGI